MNNNRPEAIFFLVVLAVAIILAFYIFWPYLSVLILAGTFAILFNPIYAKILKFLKGREIIAAWLTVFIFLLLVLVPLAFLGFKILIEASNLYSSLASGTSGDGLPATVSNLIQNLTQKFHLPAISIDFNAHLRELIVWLLQNIGPVFSSLASVFVHVFLGLLGFFFLLKDGGKFKKKIILLLPLSPGYSEEIFLRLERVVNSVIRGALVVAILQGVVAGIGFTIFGVPNAILWGMIAALAALIPAFGTSLVMIPAIIYLFIAGNTISGFGLLVWAILAVGLIDNLLSPYLMKRGTEIHPFFILLSVLGGISLMGPIGFLAGPLFLSFLFALLDIYPVLILNKKE